MSKNCQDCGQPLKHIGALLECSNPNCALHKVTLEPDQFPIPEDVAESYRVMNRRVKSRLNKHQE